VGSAVPGAIEALVELWSGEFDPDEVLVEDGPPTHNLDGQAAIGVGVPVDDNQAAQAIREFGADSANEPVDLDCTVECWSGDSEELPALRRRVFALLDQAEASLGQLSAAQVWDARITSWSYRPIRGEQGAAAVLVFTVRLNTYR
jgi:hypothetical protein